MFDLLNLDTSQSLSFFPSHAFLFHKRIITHRVHHCLGANNFTFESAPPDAVFPDTLSILKQSALSSCAVKVSRHSLPRMSHNASLPSWLAVVKLFSLPAFQSMALIQEPIPLNTWAALEVPDGAPQSETRQPSSDSESTHFDGCPKAVRCDQGGPKRLNFRGWKQVRSLLCY